MHKLESSYSKFITEELDTLGISWKDAPDWCDDCNSNPGEKCPDCGYTHNC
jgi:hypothetical protein